MNLKWLDCQHRFYKPGMLKFLKKLFWKIALQNIEIAIRKLKNN